MEVEEQRYRRLRQLALDQGWFLVGETRNSKPLGYRLVHVKTGAKGPGHGSEGPVTLDEVEAFLTKEPLK
jgi:hypothetical protein